MSIHLSQMIPASSTFSIEAEKKLLVDLLDSDIFSYQDEVHRHLAIYPNTNFFLKEHVIKILMESLWGNKHLFEVFQVFESLLAAVGKRGHYIHQFEVFLLGINFILLSQKRGVELGEVYKFKEKDSIFYTWLFASTAHDFGYSVEASEKIFDKISGMYSDFGFPSVSEKIKGKEIVKDIRDSQELRLVDTKVLGAKKGLNIRDIVYDCLEHTLDLDEAALKGLQDKLEKNLSHGYVGSIILYKSLSDSLSTLLPLKYFEENWIQSTIRYVIGSICSHGFNFDKDNDKDFSSYVESISFDKNPYAYLLFVFDNLQDWSRELVVSEKWPTYCLNDFYTSESDGVYFLQYAIKHRTWKYRDPDTKEETDVRDVVNSNIENKRRIIALASGPKDRLNITIHVDFQVNCDMKIDPIIVEL